MEILTLTHNGSGLRPPSKGGPAALASRPTFLETIMGEGGYVHPFPLRGQVFFMMDNYFHTRHLFPIIPRIP